MAHREWRLTSYLQEFMKPLMDQTHVGCPSRGLTNAKGVLWRDSTYRGHFDEVVIAAHADQALRMRPQASDMEREILSAFPYQGNEAVSIRMNAYYQNAVLPGPPGIITAPRSKPRKKQPVTLTYNLNILQGHAADTQFLVSLNPRQRHRSNKNRSTNSLCPSPIFRPCTGRPGSACRN